MTMLSPEGNGNNTSCKHMTKCLLYGRHKEDKPKVYIYMKKDITPDEQIISREPFPASRKIYVKGQLHEIHVAMREIAVGNTVDRFSDTETPNLPVTVYDTSGPYTDPAIDVDLRKGLPRLREKWVL